MAEAKTNVAWYTKEIVDPLKKQVATPYSEYLKTQVGKGLPQYEGEKPWESEAYKSFADLDPGEWFQGAVADPAMKEFKEELLPEIREGYAGSLRGSGRFKAEEAGISQFSEYLATERTKAMRDIPKEQFAMKQQKYMMEYNDWLKSLPQNNPALQLASQFLSKQTSTGTTILSTMQAEEEAASGVNWGGAAGGAVSGAVAGGLYGSVVPGIGTAVGAGVGMVIGAIAGGWN